MLHLSSERLAALADNEPTPAEASHLSACPACAAARRAQQALLASAQLVHDRTEAPLNDWNTISLRLQREGLVHTAPITGAAVRAWRRMGFLAAGLALLVGGTALGRISAGASLVPTVALVDTALDAPAAERSFASTAEAMDALLRAQREYRAASAFLASNNAAEGGSSRAMFARLAALEEMQAASIAVLKEAPTDPVMNDLYVSTLGAREATLRQINQVIPAGMTVKRY